MIPVPPLVLPEGTVAQVFFCPECQRPASGYVSPAAIDASDLGQALAVLTDAHRKLDLCERCVFFEVRPMPLDTFSHWLVVTARLVWGATAELRAIMDAWTKQLDSRPTGWIRIVCDDCGLMIGVGHTRNEQEEARAAEDAKQAHRLTSSCPAKRGHFNTVTRSDAGFLMVQLVEFNTRRGPPPKPPPETPPEARPRHLPPSLN